MNNAMKISDTIEAHGFEWDKLLNGLWVIGVKGEDVMKLYRLDIPVDNVDEICKRIKQGEHPTTSYAYSVRYADFLYGEWVWTDWQFIDVAK